MIGRSRFWEEFRSGISAATSKQIGLVDEPHGDELGGEDLTFPYAIVYPIVDQPEETSMDDPADSVDILVQFTLYGESPRQVLWMSDKVQDIMLGRNPGGDFSHAIVSAEMGVAWRLPVSRGAIIAAGANTYTSIDQYRIRRTS